MFEQKSTETVTLTKTQLKAILELMTQIGGIGQREGWNEQKISYKSDNKKNYKRSESDYKNDESFNTNNHYWEREDVLDRDNWYSLRDDRDLRQSNNILTQYSTSNKCEDQALSPTPTNISRPEGSAISSVMTNHSRESKFRRYAKINDFEFDINELQQKRNKTLEYRRDLAQQKEEKDRKKLIEKEKLRIEEESLERRVREQRQRMINDYELEQKLIQQKRQLAERKREAVIAAIEKTPIIKKKNFLIDNNCEETNGQQTQQSSITVATIRPQARTKEICVQTDICSKNCDIGTQTDVQLLLNLLKQMNYQSNEKINSDRTEAHSDSNSSTNSQMPKILRKSNDSTKSRSLINRPVWGVNKQTKNYIKNTDKYLNQNLETRKKLKEKDVQQKKVNKDFSGLKNTNEPNNSEKRLDESQKQLLTQPLRKNSRTMSYSAKNISEYNEKLILDNNKTKLNFLPEISARPHSRKKWYSQEAFDPHFLS